MTNDEIYSRWLNGSHPTLPPLPTVRYAMHEKTAWGYTDARVIRGSSNFPPPEAFGPPHPSWCYPLWHSHAGTV